MVVLAMVFGMLGIVRDQSRRLGVLVAILSLVVMIWLVRAGIIPTCP